MEKFVETALTVEYEPLKWFSKRVSREYFMGFLPTNRDANVRRFSRSLIEMPFRFTGEKP